MWVKNVIFFNTSKKNRTIVTIDIAEQSNLISDLEISYQP